MANAEALYETLDVILANLASWNQLHYIHGDYRIAAPIGECGTTQCIAGFKCLIDGLQPIRDGRDDETSLAAFVDRFVDPATGIEYHPETYACGRFELNDREADALFHYYTDDYAKLKQRVHEIVAGEWRNEVAW